MSFLMKQESDNGDIVEFKADEPILLSYQDMLDVKNSGKCNLKFRIKAGEATLNGTALEEDTTVTMLTTPKEKHTIYALTFGGWLPLAFAGESMMLADRNFLDRMKKIKIGQKNTELESTKWWTDMILHQNATIVPILYAYEGENREFPSFNDFCRIFDEGVKIIQQYSLKSTVYGLDDYKISYQILENLKLETEKEIEFLIEVSPLVALTHDKKKRDEAQIKIDCAVEEIGLPESSLAYLLVLSCLYADGSKINSFHAREILKPKKVYSRENAYNTVMDLLHLKMLLLSKKLPFENKTYFCTADFHLAAFWVGLNVHDINVEEGNIMFSCDIENIMPLLKTVDDTKLRGRT